MKVFERMTIYFAMNLNDFVNRLKDVLTLQHVHNEHEYGLLKHHVIHFKLNKYLQEINTLSSAISPFQLHMMTSNLDRQTLQRYIIR